MTDQATSAVTGVDVVRSAALDALTPAHMATMFNLDAGAVWTLAKDRLDLELSHGARTGHTYTKDDLVRFDAKSRAMLFDLLIEHYGTQVLLQGMGASDWWKSGAGKTMESVLSLADVSVGHVSPRRAPLLRRDYWVGLTGYIGSILVMCFTFFILFPPYLVAKRSWRGWQDTTKDRPKAAIVIGWILIAVPAVLVVAAAITSLFNG
jgi:hypothetical protein